MKHVFNYLVILVVESLTNRVLYGPNCIFSPYKIRSHHSKRSEAEAKFMRLVNKVIFKNSKIMFELKNSPKFQEIENFDSLTFKSKRVLCSTKYNEKVKCIFYRCFSRYKNICTIHLFLPKLGKSAISKIESE